MKIILKLDLWLRSRLPVILQGFVMDPCLRELLLVGWESRLAAQDARPGMLLCFACNN